MGTLRQPTRRERQREATYEEIVRASRELLAENAELSLRAVAAKMGMTAPALYRYVASYQDLVDLVAFEIDKAATETFVAAADRQPEGDPAARLIAACVAFRRWALTHPREFSLVFANPLADPLADSACAPRELLTVATSGHYLNSLLMGLWHETHFDYPELDDLDPVVADSLRDPMIPIEMEMVPDGRQGLLWVFTRAWSSLYGTVTLEVFGHVDPRLIESGALFVEMVGEWMPRLGIDPTQGYADLLRAEIAR